MKDMFLDFIIRLLILLVLNAILFGVIGWCYAIFLVFSENNWLPIAIICTFAMLVCIVGAILNAVYKCYKNFSATGTKDKFTITYLKSMRYENKNHS